MSSRETHYCCSAAVTVLSGRYITLGLKDQKREKKKERERERGKSTRIEEKGYVQV